MVRQNGREHEISQTVLAAKAWYERADLRRRNFKRKARGFPPKQARLALEDSKAGRSGWSEAVVRSVSADKSQAELIGWYTRYEFCKCCRSITMTNFLPHVAGVPHLVYAFECSARGLTVLVRMMQNYALLRENEVLCGPLVELVLRVERLRGRQLAYLEMASLTQSYLAQVNGPFLFDPDWVYAPVGEA